MRLRPRARCTALALGIAQVALAQRAPTGTIVTSNIDAGTISIVNIASAEALATTTVGASPHKVAIASNGKQAVVAIHGNRTAVGRSLAGIVVTTLPVRTGSDGIGYRPIEMKVAHGRVIDLGHSLASTDPTWSGKPTFERTGSSRMGRISTDEHYGTHFDAPSHGGGQLSVDLVPADRLVRPGICIAMTGKPEDYQISAADVHAWEAKHGLVPEGSIVLFATGWDARWPDQARYMNERDGVKHFPGIAADAAIYLRDRKIVGMGIDTPSVDYGPSQHFETHAITNPAGIFHIESAANLTQLPATGFTVIVAPIKIAGGSGGPTRMFALVP